MEKLKILIVLTCGLLLFGCASNPMKVSGEVAVSKPAANEAQVVFMRDSFVGSAISASLYDVTEKEPVFIGVITNGTKVIYTTSPGEHTFMVVSEAADFMEANLAAGKTYYSIVTPRMGAWKARFSMWPVKTDPSAEYNTGSKDFESWKNNTKVATNTDAARAWYEVNKASIIKKQQEYWAVWQEKSEADVAKRSLSSEDGM